MVEFYYKKEHSKVLGDVYRPCAQVILQHKSVSVLFYPYIDSGADITLISKSLGDALGLEIDGEKIIELGGLGNNKVPVLIKKIQVNIGHYHLPVQVAWALIEEVPAILGRRDIFTHFRVVFDEEQGTIQFLANPSIVSLR